MVSSSSSLLACSLALKSPIAIVTFVRFFSVISVASGSTGAKSGGTPSGAEAKASGAPAVVQAKARLKPKRRVVPKRRTAPIGPPLPQTPEEAEETERQLPEPPAPNLKSKSAPAVKVLPRPPRPVTTFSKPPKGEVTKSDSYVVPKHQVFDQYQRRELTNKNPKEYFAELGKPVLPKAVLEVAKSNDPAETFYAMRDDKPKNPGAGYDGEIPPDEYSAQWNAMEERFREDYDLQLTVEDRTQYPPQPVIEPFYDTKTCEIDFRPGCSKRTQKNILLDLLFNDAFAWTSHTSNNCFGRIHEGEFCSEFLNGCCMLGMLCPKSHFADVGTSNTKVYVMPNFNRLLLQEDRRYCDVKYLEFWNKKKYTIWCDAQHLEGTMRILQGKTRSGRDIRTFSTIEFLKHFKIKLLKVPLYTNLETILESGTLHPKLFEEELGYQHYSFLVDDCLFDLMTITNPNKCHPHQTKQLYTLFQIDDRANFTPNVDLLMKNTIEAYGMEATFRNAIEDARCIGMEHFKATFHQEWIEAYRTSAYVIPQSHSVNSPWRNATWDSMQKIHEWLELRHPLTRCKPFDTDFWRIQNGMLPNYWNYPHFQIGQILPHSRPSEEALNESRRVNGMPVTDKLSVLQHQFPYFQINPMFVGQTVTLVPQPSFRIPCNETAMYADDTHILSEDTYGSMRDALLGKRPGDKGLVGSNYFPVPQLNTPLPLRTFLSKTQGNVFDVWNRCHGTSKEPQYVGFINGICFPWGHAFTHSRTLPREFAKHFEDIFQHYNFTEKNLTRL